MLKAPCKQCEVRTVGCHKKCKPYQEYRQTREQIIQSRHDNNEQEYQLYMATNRYKRG